MTVDTPVRQFIGEGGSEEEGRGEEGRVERRDLRRWGRGRNTCGAKEIIQVVRAIVLLTETDIRVLTSQCLWRVRYEDFCSLRQVSFRQ